MNLDNTMLSEKKSDIKGRTYTNIFYVKSKDGQELGRKNGGQSRVMTLFSGYTFSFWNQAYDSETVTHQKPLNCLVLKKKH